LEGRSLGSFSTTKLCFRKGLDLGVAATDQFDVSYASLKLCLRLRLTKAALGCLWHLATTEWRSLELHYRERIEVFIWRCLETAQNCAGFLISFDGELSDKLSKVHAASRHGYNRPRSLICTRQIAWSDPICWTMFNIESANIASGRAKDVRRNTLHRQQLSTPRQYASTKVNPKPQ
jgi:hypothetical protein